MKQNPAAAMRKAAISRLRRLTSEATEVLSTEQLNRWVFRLAAELDKAAEAKGHHTGYAAGLERELGKL